MSHRVRDMIYAGKPRKASPLVSRPAYDRGPHPTLIDVFRRHPAWKKRLVALLAVDPRERWDLTPVRKNRQATAARLRELRRKGKR